MSGIVGIINLDGAPVDRELLCRLTDFMSFRGPDAQQVWTEENIGFGHALLRTTREAETEKYLLTLDSRVWITADARIDDRAVLIDKLEDKLGRRLKHAETSTNDSGRQPNDAQLILYAYEAWGDNCVQHIIGDFAFAIWDTRFKHLFCARDHFGVKPFFFAQLHNSFIFSNTLNALRQDNRVTEELNESAVADFLLFGLNQDPSTTTFRDIHRLAASNCLSISDRSISIRRYWSPSTNKQIKYRDRQTYVEHFQELLIRAVEDRLHTNRVGISMSGGLDSTGIAAIASDLAGRDAVHAFSTVYDSLIPDEERRYSTLAADTIGVAITYLKADGYSLFDSPLKTSLDQPEPFLLSPLAGQFNDLLQLLAQFSRVALTGYDGDAFMDESPRTYFAKSTQTLRFNDLISGLAWFVWTQKRLPPVGFRTRLRQWGSKSRVDTSYPEWVDDSFAARTNLRDRWNDVMSEPICSDESRPSALRALNSKVWAPLFEGYDSGATRLPLELRHPLIDLRLIEYLLAIPAVPWCVNKHILRVALKDRLPTTVLKRRKTPLEGDPALQLARDGSVRWLDSFEAAPQLSRFVNLKLRRSVADEPTPEGLWANLRLFALNYWLTHSLPNRSAFVVSPE